MYMPRSRRRLPLAQNRSRPRWLQLARLGVVALLVWLAPLNAAARQGQGQSPTPSRHVTIRGQVISPAGRVVQRVMVKVAGRGGINLTTFANDNGNYEFNDLPAGTYSLTAGSMVDPTLSSDAVETDTSRTATDFLNINLYLRERRVSESGGGKAKLVSAVDAGQRVPGAASKAFKQGLKLKERHQPDEALASFSRALELYPEYYQALAARGDLYLDKHLPTEAAADFASALKYNARYAPALRGAGYCQLEKREFAAAAQLFEQTIAADPENADALLLLGMADFELDRREASMKALHQALKLDALRAARAHIHLGHVFNDGPPPTGLRYCMNGVAMRFVPSKAARPRRTA